MSYKISYEDQQVLQRLNHLENHASKVVYRGYDGNQVLFFMNLVKDVDLEKLNDGVFCWVLRIVGQIIKTKNGELLLIIGSDIKNLNTLLPVVTAKCEELLYVNKLRHDNQSKNKESGYKREKDIIATEQERDIYQSCAKAYPAVKRLFCSKERPQIVLLDDGITVKHENYYYGPQIEYRIGYPIIKKRITQKLFNNGQTMVPKYLEPQEGKDGKYHLTINGNDFSFATWDGANNFGSLFDERWFQPVSKPGDTIFFRYKKPKMRRQR